MAKIYIKRPTCINHGCNKKVTHCGSRYRPVCASCHMAGYGKIEYPYGVLPFKTGICTNQDGHLNFKCAIDYRRASWAIGKTQIDHIDGNHLNNTLKNCEELCSLCHTFKGMLTGDFKNQNGRYNKAYKAYNA